MYLKLQSYLNAEHIGSIIMSSLNASTSGVFVRAQYLNMFKGKLKRKCALRRATETRTVIAQKLLEIDIFWW